MSDEKKYEKSDSLGTHSIESGAVMVCAETGRVVAVFYNDYDLDDILKRLTPSEINQE